MLKKDADDFELNFFEGVVRERPNYVEALVPLAHVYTRLGFHEKSLEIDKRLAGLCKHDPVIHYNLACSYSLLGQLPQSLTALKKAVRLGFQDLRYIEKDQDLKNLCTYRPFLRWMETVKASQFTKMLGKIQERS
ncbi:MAG: hypothetical protein BWY44_01353 [Candidatus Omnitrophica bacterium ADurb.Bin292]|jgi:tetratricopeptide (TPR) repeat protein|nr:MAG: hypothetical protein BWY44_01353 [Candidatus Omnitrophica bacterium ADurb.Bin292]HOG23639.1 tetratricopeptide repeat protein [Candidatus Omnitrophota bacterium]HPW76986.1 tetratricopeptide repeat protein [Candidatus Omnitrophota bacterium]HQB11822.1 tetratricopeptide repeat protein [Candidatus Omnitrophota bacterium]